MESTASGPGPDQLAALRDAAISDDAEARRATAERLRGMLEADFEATFDATQSWVFDSNDRVREVACRALLLKNDDSDDVRTRRLISRAELFLGGSSRPAARLASREVLPYLLGLQPRLIQDWIRTWIENQDELTRVDLAGVLAGLAPRFPAEAVDALAALAVDPRPKVKAGFSEALRDIIARKPEMAPYIRSRFPGRV